MLIGIVGKSNVGKSTFFKAATLAEVEISNRPFTTIKPNHGVGFIRVRCAEKDFSLKCSPKAGYCLDGERFVPVELLDVAGLVPGAHEGRGMGNQFLDDLRQADALVHIIDVSGSTNENGEEASPGSYNPANDILFLEEELDMWYLRLLKKPWEKLSREAKMNKIKAKEAIAKQFSGLNVTEPMVDELITKLQLTEDLTSWSEEKLTEFASHLRQKTKPMIIAANKADMKTGREYMKELRQKFPQYIIVPCSSESELALREAARKLLIKYIPGDKNFEMAEQERLSEKQKHALHFIKQEVLEIYGNTGVQQVLNKAVFELLKCIAVYPVANSKLADKDGNVMPDCFLVKEGTTALEFAYKVHTTLGDNFIRAMDMRTKQTIGKEHKLKNNDVIEIMSR